MRRPFVQVKEILFVLEDPNMMTQRGVRRLFSRLFKGTDGILIRCGVYVGVCTSLLHEILSRAKCVNLLFRTFPNFLFLHTLAQWTLIPPQASFGEPRLVYLRVLNTCFAL